MPPIETLQRDISNCVECIDVLNIPRSLRLTATTSATTSAVSDSQVSRSSRFSRFSYLKRGVAIFRYYQLDFVGKKDVLVALSLIVMILLFIATYWSLTLVNERRAVPSKAIVINTNDWRDALQFNEKFCNSSSATRSFDVHLCDERKIVELDEIARCLGCNPQDVFTRVVVPIFSVIRFTVPMTISCYALSDLGKLNGKSLMKKLVIIWLVTLPLLAAAAQVIAMTKRAVIFLLFYFFANLLALSVILRYWSIECQVDRRWLPLWIVCIVGTVAMRFFPQGHFYVPGLKPYLPIILICLETLACRLTMLCFKEYRDNHLGQAVCIGFYIWLMEAVRFDCFMALYLGWKSNVFQFQDVFLNMLFSVLGEIWTHTGIRDVFYDWFDKKVTFIQMKSDFEEIRTIFSSIRHVVAWVLPAITLGMVCFNECDRDYIPVSHEKPVVNQLRFLTSVLLFKHIFEIVLVFYLVEVICLTLCGLVSYLMDYREISLVGSLSRSHILLFVVFLGLQAEVGFEDYFWSADEGDRCI